MPFKYLHIDTRNMTQKNGKSIYQVNLNHHPIKGAKRVAVVKAILPNSNFNVEESQNTHSIDITNVSTGDSTVITIPDGVYTIESVLVALNTEITASSISNDIVFGFNGTRVSITNNSSSIQYSIYINTLLKELGFEDTSSNDIALPNYVDPAFNRPVVAEHFPTIENTPFFYIDSPELAGSVLTVNENNNNEVIPGNHLASIMNNVPRNAYLTYEASSPLYHELHGDLHHFTIEIKNHNKKHFSSFHKLIMVLAFEYEPPFEYYEQQRKEYASQGYAMAHKI